MTFLFLSLAATADTCCCLSEVFGTGVEQTDPTARRAAPPRSAEA